MALYTKEEREVIRKKLIRWRELTELSEQQAAVICNITLEEYKKLETGEIQINGSILDRAAWFSEINAIYFFREKSYENFESILIKKLEKRKKDFWAEYKTDSKILAEKLLAIRKAHNLTQEQMAKIAHIKRESYMLTEKGKGLLNKVSICCVADFFDVPVVDFLNNELHPFIFSASYRGRLEYPQRERRKKVD